MKKVTLLLAALLATSVANATLNEDINEEIYQRTLDHIEASGNDSNLANNVDLSGLKRKDRPREIGEILKHCSMYGFVTVSMMDDDDGTAIVFYMNCSGVKMFK